MVAIVLWLRRRKYGLQATEGGTLPAIICGLILLWGRSGA
jgi:hypothetical protein